VQENLYDVLFMEPESAPPTRRERLPSKPRRPAFVTHHCTQCEYVTPVPSNLARHMRKHTGEKLFQCRYCDKSCARSDDLAKHERSHTGDKPYTCRDCKYTSVDVSNMNRHCRMRAHARDK
jgi:hypothetical protein